MYVNEISFSYERMDTKTRFKKEPKVRTAQSRHASVCESHSIKCESILFVTNNIP